MGWHDERKSNNGAYGCAQYAHHNRLHSSAVPQDQKVTNGQGISPARSTNTKEYKITAKIKTPTQI